MTFTGSYLGITSGHITGKTIPDRESQSDDHIRILFHLVSAWNLHRDRIRPFWRILSIVQIQDKRRRAHFRVSNFYQTTHLNLKFSFKVTGTSGESIVTFG